MFRSSRTATVIVAASDAEQISQTEADYVCDGVDDDVEIQAALDSLPANGGKIFLSEGIFTLSNQITRAIDSVCIIGSGAGTRINWDGAQAVISFASQNECLLLYFDTDAGGVAINSTSSTARYWKDGVWIDTGTFPGHIRYTNAEALTQAAIVVNAIRIDEDDMVSDSALFLPSQQSVKAYVDNSISGVALTQEEVEDFAGALIVTGGTKTGIAITYNDNAGAAGDIDFVVDHDGGTNFTQDEHFTMLDEDNLVTDSNTQAATQQSIKAYVDALDQHSGFLGLDTRDTGPVDPKADDYLDLLEGPNIRLEGDSPAAGEITITAMQGNFLGDKRVYAQPVTIPHRTNGGAQKNVRVHGPYNIPASAIAQSVWIYCGEVSEGNPSKCKGLIYDDVNGDGEPGALIGESTEVNVDNVTLDWIEFPITGGVALTGGANYFIGIHVGGDGAEGAPGVIVRHTITATDNPATLQGTSNFNSSDDYTDGAADPFEADPTETAFAMSAYLSFGYTNVYAVAAVEAEATLNLNAVIASGDVTGLTINPTGDTTAADNAAIGYTATEGLVLTGQGSGNDVTIKNDADATVLWIDTGTINVKLGGDLIFSGTDNIIKGTLTSIYMEEDAAAAADIAGNGQFWVDSATSLPMFTGDDGVDHVLAFV